MSGINDDGGGAQVQHGDGAQVHDELHGDEQEHGSMS